MYLTFVKLVNTMDNNIKQRIYDCALELFSQQGYDGTSIRQIAEKANTTIPMIYYYYKSKGQLLQDILNGGIKQLQDSVKTDSSSPPQQQLETAIYRFLAYCSENRAMTALIFQMWFGAGTCCRNIPSIIRFYTEIVEQFDRILVAGMEAGCFRAHDHLELSQNIIGVLTNYIARMLIGNENIDPARYGKATIEFIIKGIHV